MLRAVRTAVSYVMAALVGLGLGIVGLLVIADLAVVLR